MILGEQIIEDLFYTKAGKFQCIEIKKYKKKSRFSFTWKYIDSESYLLDADEKILPYDMVEKIKYINYRSWQGLTSNIKKVDKYTNYDIENKVSDEKIGEILDLYIEEIDRELTYIEKEIEESKERKNMLREEVEELKKR